MDCMSARRRREGGQRKKRDKERNRNQWKGREMETRVLKK